MTESVVVPAVEVPSSLACLRSLRKRGINTIVVSERDSPEAFCSRYCDEAINVPSPEENVEEYKDALLQLAKRSDVRTIIPMREEDVYVLSKYRESFGKYVGTPWPEFEKLRRIHDRIELYDAAENAGVPVPETHLLTECDDWSWEWITKARYVLVGDEYNEADVEVDGGGTVKRTRVNPSRGIYSPPSTEYLAPGTKPDVDMLCAKAGHVPLVQEYMYDTDEYAFFAIYDRGEPLATFQHRQIRGFKYSGGSSAFRKSVQIPELEAEGLKLLDHLDWHGPAMVEFKKDGDTGEFKLMEVNPRFWSSLPFSVQAGADFPAYYWWLANGQTDRIDPGYVVGIGGHLAMGEIFYLYSILDQEVPLVERPSFVAALGTILSSVVRHPRFDYLDISDPCPAVRYAYNHAKKLWS
jgi:predicted ATP-grasp superfamily ATP-dependent carboligase